jgi:poly(A) polymerase
MNRTALTDAAWFQSPELKAVVAALSSTGERPRIVGGAIRDGLLGLPVADVDLATTLTPDKVIGVLEKAGIKAVPTGIDHGTVTAVSAGKTFEITTLRRDVSTDGRRATVAFSTDWQEDAARRDFTINALYADPETGDVFDYFGGLNDLKAGVVRFIGDATARIAEDHLRILRYFRFYARFGKSAPDAGAIAACEAAAKSLMALSRERIADELIKLLALPDPSNSVRLMVEHKIFAAFLPELSVNAAARLERLLVRERTAGLEAKASRRISALLPDNPIWVEQVASRLKLSNKTRLELSERTTELQPQSPSATTLGYRHGVAMATDIFLLHGDETAWLKGVEALRNWTPPIFPIKGGEIVSRGLTAGPLVAKTLKAAEQQWIAEGFPDATRANAIADQCVAEMLSAKNA